MKLLKILTVFSVFALQALLVRGKVCSNNSECDANENCIISALAGGAKCQKGTCQCRSCYGRANDTAPCSQAQLVKPCDWTCQSSECDASCSPQSSNEIYPPNSQCATISADINLVKCDDCYKPVQGECVRKSRSSPLGRGANCARDSCACGSTLACVGTCSCPLGKYWNSTTGRCATRQYGDSCSQDSDCSLVGSLLTSSAASNACVNGKCSCRDGYSNVETSYVEPLSQKLAKVTNCIARNLASGLKIGDVCAKFAVSDQSRSQLVGVCPQNSICFACPVNKTVAGTDSSLLESTCRNFSPPSATAPTNCPTNVQASTAAGKNSVGKLCATNSDCGPNEACIFDNVQPACSFGFCRCKQCFDLYNSDSICQPVTNLAFGASCTESASENYPSGAFCDGGKVVCAPGYSQTGTNGCQRVEGRIQLVTMGGRCRRSTDCASNLQCDVSSPVCDCFGPDKKWDAASNTCIVKPTSVGTDGNGCFRCPEDDSKAACRVLDSSSSGAARPYDQCFDSTARASPKCTLATQKECASDSDCSSNQVCLQVEPCSKKYCTCKSCFGTDSTGTCSPNTKLRLNDNCTEASNEILENSMICRGGVVACRQCYQATSDGKQCSWTPKSQQPGQSCQSYCDCGSNLHCDASTSTCQCPNPFDLWSQKDGACLVRSFGDACTKDAECQLGGRLGRGYTTPTGGKCVNGACGCANGYTATTTGFLYKGTFSSRQICIVSAAALATNATRGAACTLDPIANADNASMLSRGGICAKDFACLKCKFLVDDDSDIGICATAPVVAASAQSSCS